MFLPRSVASRKAESHKKPVRPQTAAKEKNKEMTVADFRSQALAQGEPSPSSVAGDDTLEVVKEPRAEEEVGPESESEEDDGPVVSYSRQQRWPKPGEPICVICGRYGAYIVDQTDKDVCSLECKAKHLRTLSSASGEYSSLPSSSHGSHSSKGEGGSGECKKGPWNYIEHGDVAGLTEAQVESLRRELSIEVKGAGMPRPVIQFTHLPLPDQVHINLREEGYVTPTPVQMQTVPAALVRKDLLVCATTGSGKTLSFLLPLIIKLMNVTPPTGPTHPRALVLAPTRELCMQIEDQAKQLMKGVPSMRTALLVGGLPIAKQLHRLKSGVQVLIATPARLNDILVHHAGDIDLSHIEVFVLDEVDCLLHMGFELQATPSDTVSSLTVWPGNEVASSPGTRPPVVSPTPPTIDLVNSSCPVLWKLTNLQVRSVEERLPARRQNLMFSATIPPRIEKMATDLMDTPLFIAVGVPGAPCESVKHIVIWVEENAKKKRLFTFLNDKKLFKPPAVVFVNSRMATLLLAEAVNKACGSAPAVALHGDMAQDRRTSVLKDFLDGKHSVVVSTGLLARGLDLLHVQQVFVFDMPTSVREFIHQIGRAGRLGAPGCAITFINNENKSVFAGLVDVLQPLGVQLPSQLLHSPHLALQREGRKRRQQGSGQGRGTKKRDTRNLYDRDTLMDLIRGTSKQ